MTKSSYNVEKKQRELPIRFCRNVINEPTNNNNEEEEEDSDRARDQWTKPVEFLLSCIASSVGLGNVWRFPFTAYDNGGGAFLIPYLIILMLIGRPLYFLELSFGQFCSYGAVKAWKCVPFLKGIGVGQVLSTFYVITYYVVLSATCVYYIGACFHSELPWKYCEAEWPNCRNSSDSAFQNSTCDLSNSSIYQNETCDSKMKSSAEMFYLHKVYRISDGIENIGDVSWQLALCLLLCWIILFLSVFKGVKSSGKTAYFTALFPYFVLIALLIVGATMEGSKDGILFFLKPEWEKLLDIYVWYKACEQMMFSLTVGYGVLVMYSSYNGFRHNITRDAIIISVLDTCTSMLAGCTIFSVIGALAYELKVPINKVVDSGQSLAFVAYPEALGRIGVVPQLWSVLFFMMLMSLAIGTSVADVSSIVTTIKDQFPHLTRWKVLLGVCVVSYSMGLIYITRGGPYILNLVDALGAGFSAFVFAIGEVIGIMWIYGMNNYCDDMSFMLGYKVGIFWKITWGILTPVILTGIFIYYLISTEPLTFGDYKYPSSVEAIGWSIGGIAIIQIPIWGLISIWRQDAPTLLEKIKKSFQPSVEWGPRSKHERREWLKIKNKSRNDCDNISCDNLGFSP